MKSIDPFRKLNQDESFVRKNVSQKLGGRKQQLFPTWDFRRNSSLVFSFYVYTPTLKKSRVPETEAQRVLYIPCSASSFFPLFTDHPVLGLRIYICIYILRAFLSSLSYKIFYDSLVSYFLSFTIYLIPMSIHYRCFYKMLKKKLLYIIINFSLLIIEETWKKKEKKFKITIINVIFSLSRESPPSLSLFLKQLDLIKR